MKKTTISRAIAAIAVAMNTAPSAAQIPAGYYDNLKGKSGAELKNAVHETIKDANVLDYGKGKGHTWEGFYTTDRTADNQVIDRYSNDTRYFGSKGSSVGGMNIEHSFPKSWWGGSENQAYKDLYNLMPSEQKINSAKSNYPMGEVSKATTDNGCTKVGTGSKGYKLWEPADKWKGDFARAYMYMATTYQNFTWKGTQALQILQKGDYPTLQPWAYKLYISWAKTDAPDETETSRNEAVSRIQGNRNPFVDFPNLMEYIWGDSTDYAFDPGTTLCTSEYTPGGEAPEQGTIYTAIFTDGTGGCTISNKEVPQDGFEVWRLDNKYGWKGTAFANNTNNAADASVVTPELDRHAHIQPCSQLLRFAGRRSGGRGHLRRSGHAAQRHQLAARQQLDIQRVGRHKPQRLRRQEDKDCIPLYQHQPRGRHLGDKVDDGKRRKTAKRHIGAINRKSGFRPVGTIRDIHHRRQENNKCRP